MIVIFPEIIFVSLNDFKHCNIKFLGWIWRWFGWFSRIWQWRSHCCRYIMLKLKFVGSNVCVLTGVSIKAGYRLSCLSCLSQPSIRFVFWRFWEINSYNKIIYARLLIVSHLWSIGGQTRRWRQHSIQVWQLRDSLNQSQFVAKHSNQSKIWFYQTSW